MGNTAGIIEEFHFLYPDELPEEIGFDGRNFLGTLECYRYPHGSWMYTHGYPLLSAEIEWQLIFGFGSRNIIESRNVTPYSKTLKSVLSEVVALYPVLLNLSIDFDGTIISVPDVLAFEIPKKLYAIQYMHGTSSAFLDDILENGLLPRSKTGAEPTYGSTVGAREGNPDAVYVTVIRRVARLAASDAVNKYGGKKIIVHLYLPQNEKKIIADIDSRSEDPWSSLASLGSVAFLGEIGPQYILEVETL